MGCVFEVGERGFMGAGRCDRVGTADGGEGKDPSCI